MRGHIRQRGKSWTIVLELEKDAVTGKRKQKWIPVKGDKKAAERRLTEILHQLDNGVFINPGKVTTGEYLKLWLSDYAKVNLSPRSFERYRDIVNDRFIPDFGNIKLAQLKPEQLQKHYATMLKNSLSARSVRYHHAVIHVALKTAMKWGLISRNVADLVEPPKIHRGEMKVWNENEVNQFLDTTKGTTYNALFYTALFTGARRSELLALRWQDIDFVYSQINISRSLHHLKDGSYVFTQPKSEKSRRTIAMPPSLFLILESYKKAIEVEEKMIDSAVKDSDLVFSHLGKPVRPNTVTRAWETIAKKAGVPVIRLHDARHTHASLMLKQGIHPKVVQERLGHSTIQMTLDIYSHVAPGIQEAAAKRFDEVIKRKEKVEEIN